MKKFSKRHPSAYTHYLYKDLIRVLKMRYKPGLAVYQINQETNQAEDAVFFDKVKIKQLDEYSNQVPVKDGFKKLEIIFWTVDGIRVGAWRPIVELLKDNLEPNLDFYNKIEPLFEEWGEEFGKVYSSQENWEIGLNGLLQDETALFLSEIVIGSKYERWKKKQDDKMAEYLYTKAYLSYLSSSGNYPDRKAYGLSSEKAKVIKNRCKEDIGHSLSF